jgi:hypothetical protein
MAAERCVTRNFDADAKKMHAWSERRLDPGQSGV